MQRIQICFQVGVPIMMGSCCVCEFTKYACRTHEAAAEIPNLMQNSRQNIRTKYACTRRTRLVSMSEIAFLSQEL